jgi:nucleotide-binding universal stress UspA family protein
MIKKILVPTDGSEHAKKAVLLAADIAGKYGARLVLLHVLLQGATSSEIRNLIKVRKLPKSIVQSIDRVEEVQLSAATMPEGFPITLPMPDDVLDAVAKTILDDAEAAAAKHGVKSVKRVVAHGRAADAILDAAVKEKANMIIMGSRGLGDLRGMLVGSVSHKVSNLAPCTCVTVK